jgi:RimJ/RimL family protein N-acetyltransferase
MTPRHIDTDRLRLRPLVVDDVDALHRLLTEPGARRYLLDAQRGVRLGDETGRDGLLEARAHQRPRHDLLRDHEGVTSPRYLSCYRLKVTVTSCTTGDFAPDDVLI